MSQMSNTMMLAFLLVSTVAVAESGTPVDKVIQLLGKLSDKVTTEGKEEAAAYDKFSCFCKSQADQKVKIISAEEAEIATLTASVQEATSEASRSSQEAGILRAQVEHENDEATANQALRNSESEVYLAQKAELEAAIAALGRAIAAMKASTSPGAGAALLESTYSSIKNLEGSEALAALMQRLERKNATETTGFVPTANDATSYTYASTDIIATMEALERQFKADLQRIQMEEGNKMSDFNRVEGARSQKVVALQHDADQQEALSAQKTQLAQIDETDLAEANAAKDADNAFLDDLTTMCETKASEWDERSKARASELMTINQAKEVLRGMGNMLSVGLVAKSKPTVHQAAVAAHGKVAESPALLQVSATPAQHKQLPVASFLENQGKNLGSKLLVAFANEVRTAGDHFVKVRGLLRELMQKLENDALAEAEQKGFCDTEMPAAVATRDQKQAEIEAGKASLDAAKVTEDKATKEIAEVAGDIAVANKALSEMTQLRLGEKAQNQKAIADAQAGAQAITNAISILAGFYGASFTQQKTSQTPTVEGAPATFEGEYKKSVAESMGIKGLLEVIASDYQKSAQERTTAEAASEAAFQADKSRMEGDIAAKTELKGTKETEKANAETEVVGFEEALREAETLHAEAQASLETLKASCVGDSTNADAQKKAREQEIEALKQAQKIFEQWS